MDQWLISLDPKIRAALIGAVVMFVVDFLTYRKAVRKAQTDKATVPDWAWELTALKVVAGFTAGFGAGDVAQVVTPPETPPVVMDAVRQLLAA